MVSVHRRVGAGLVLLAAITLPGCSGPTPAAAAGNGITISPEVPNELPAANNKLSDAATFAWNEFIALNWPAVAQTGGVNTRDMAEDTATFGVPNDGRPLVWHTFRSKIEIFPPNGTAPNGYVADSAQSYGYDSTPVYYGSNLQPANPPPSSDTVPDPVPWINLDETSEIGLDAMYAGVASQGSLNGLILFTAKANRAEYNYVAANQYYDTTTRKTANKLSSAFVVANDSSPTPNTTANGVSLPNGTIEIKAAWRQLTPTEVSSGRFYQTRVRYYPTPTTYVDTVMGLVALHIIQKTPDRPHFVFATFEQADNILTADGVPVEDEDGSLRPGYDTLSPTDPVLTAQPAAQPGPQGYDSAGFQQLGPSSVTSTPGSRLYYINAPGLLEPQGTISVNRRVHGIPSEIITANRAAHAAMAAYAEQNGLRAAVWQYYKLINVQYQPMNKTPGVDYTGADAATYYQANIVVETDQNLQTFSGRFQPSYVYMRDSSGVTIPDTVSGGTLITDWCGSNATVTGCPQPPDTGANGPIYNVYSKGTAYNMGGCMGCHGNAQVGGGDFSFLASGGKNAAPDTTGIMTAPNTTGTMPPSNTAGTMPPSNTAGTMPPSNTAGTMPAPYNVRRFEETFGRLGAVRAASRASPQQAVPRP